MQSSQMPSAGDLLVTIDVREPVVVGLSVFASIRVLNRGPVPLVTSARLNLMEGDLALIVQCPDGQKRTIKGWQADTAMRRVTLEPGEEIISGVNLLSDEAGPVFPAPGKYELTAEFTFSPQQPAACSDAFVVSARLPESDDEREIARLLQDDTVRDAILLAKPDSAPDALRTLATRFATTPDGILAELLVSASDADLPATLEPELVAHAVTMLQTPFSQVGRQIADRFTANLQTQTVRGNDTSSPDNLAVATQIAKRMPFKRK